jgi:predicted membrane protein DUF2231
VFDTILGLPVHALVVHGVVVLLPLMAVLSVLVALLPRWRAVATTWVVVGDTVVLVLAYVAKESGEQLLARLQLTGEQIETHEKYGDLLPWVALGLLVSGVLLWFAVQRRPALLPLAIPLVVVAAVVVLVMTFLTGDSGARAVWESVVSHTSPG